MSTLALQILLIFTGVKPALCQYPLEHGQKYVGNPLVCKKCHEEQYKFWEGTKHSAAYLVLYARNQHFDPKCIRCHTLGFMEKGGFDLITRPAILQEITSQNWVEGLMEKVFEKSQAPLDSKKEPNRFAKLKNRYHDLLNEDLMSGRVRKSFISVQCEHCHGSRVEHVATGKRGAAFSVKNCKECHHPPNADAFDLAKLPKASCPKRKR